MAQRSDTGDLRRVGNTQNKQQAGHFEKEVLPVFFIHDNRMLAERAFYCFTIACGILRAKSLRPS